MPQPKGYEPFSRFWVVHYSVIKISGAVPAGTALPRPRVRILLSRDDADFFYTGLLAEAKIAENYPAPGTILAPVLKKFYNRKSFVQLFVQGECDSVATGV